MSKEIEEEIAKAKRAMKIQRQAELNRSLYIPDSEDIGVLEGKLPSYVRGWNIVKRFFENQRRQK